VASTVELPSPQQTEQHILGERVTKKPESHEEVTMRKLTIACVISMATATGALAFASTAAAAPHTEPVAQHAATTAVETRYYYGTFDTYAQCDAFGRSGLGEEWSSYDCDWFFGDYDLYVVYLR
jgi:hypothetical protein